MATDYDAPRTRGGEEEPDSALASLEALRASKSEQASSIALADDVDPSERELDLPDADLSGEELTIAVAPKQADEFTCTRCWLVHHRSQQVKPGLDVCRDCAA